MPSIRRIVNQTPKLIVFDCDGTLVDSQHMICAAMQKAYDSHHLPCPSRDRLLSIVGLSLHEAFARLGAEEADFPVASLVEAYRSAFFRLRQERVGMEPLYAGAREAVEQLAALEAFRLGIATGKSQRGVRMVLGHHGLLQCFSTIKTADDAPSKPHPGMVLDAMREVGTQPDDTIVIGDTVYDIQMAHAAGTRAIGVGWGYHAVDDLRSAGADMVIDSFAQLLPALTLMKFTESGPPRVC